MAPGKRCNWTPKQNVNDSHLRGLCWNYKLESENWQLSYCLSVNTLSEHGSHAIAIDVWPVNENIRGYRKFVLTQNFFTKKFAIEIGKASFATKNTQIYAGKLKNQQSKSETQCWSENQQTLSQLPTRAPSYHPKGTRKNDGFW